MLLNNDLGGVSAAAQRVQEIFAHELPTMKNMLDDLAANFKPGGQGPDAYAEQMLVDHPEGCQTNSC